MNVQEILARLRSMNHMIELDSDNLPGLEDEDEWREDWVRFHDTMTGMLVCVNENCQEEDENGEITPIGEICVCSGTYYNNAVVIPVPQVEKYLLAEVMKSHMLTQAAHAVEQKAPFNHIL